MADVRINELTAVTSPDDNDVIPVDKGAGSSSPDLTRKLTLSALWSLLSSRTMQLLNKTLVSPSISTGMTVGFTDIVSNLNADRVDGYHAGSTNDCVPILSTSPAAGRLHAGLLGKEFGSFYRMQSGLGSVTHKHNSGTLNMTTDQCGVIQVEATAACTINLPAPSSPGILVEIIHGTGAFNIAINAPSGSVISRLNDSLVVKAAASISINSVGSRVLLIWDGGGHWDVITGQYSGLE